MPALAGAGPMQVRDLRDDIASPVNEIILRAGFRALLIAPLVRGREVVGMLVVAPPHAGRLPAKYHRTDQDLRGAIRSSDSECATVPRDRGEEPRIGTGGPAQVAIPRQHEP